MWRPATPSFCWSWSRQRPAFILGRNRWLNMTGRKWESEAGDASRYCQITRRMRQISLFLHLVLVISLASFSSLISLVWSNVVGGLINLALTMRRNYLKQQRYPNLFLPGYGWIWKRDFPKKINRYNKLFDISLICAEQEFSCCATFCCAEIFTIKYSMHSQKPPLQHRWTYLRKRHLFPLWKTMERKWIKEHEDKTHHLHRSIKPMSTTTF